MANYVGERGRVSTTGCGGGHGVGERERRGGVLKKHPDGVEAAWCPCHIGSALCSPLPLMAAVDAHPATAIQTALSNQVDVIESNYKVLEEHVGAAQDFAQAERAHTHFLHALVNQCFLNTGTITRAIGAVFTQVQVWGCGKVESGRVGGKKARKWVISVASTPAPSRARSAPCSHLQV